MQLRPYQTETTFELSKLHVVICNVLAVLPTGAGKTVILASVIHGHVGASCTIAHRQELVGQISMALAREGVKHRIIAPKSVRNEIIQQQTMELGCCWVDPAALAAVAGVDTLIRRKDELAAWCRSVTLWVVDEAHHVLTNNKWGEAVAMFPNAKGLGVTATPCRADGMGLGSFVDGVFDHMIEGPTMRWLINEDYLTDYRVFAPPSDININDVPISSTGDFSKPKLKAAVQKSHIVGDIVTHYRRIAPGKLGVVFVDSVDTAHTVADEFQSVGINAVAISAKTQSKERNRLLREFKARRITVLVNVDLFGEGFDLPAIEVAIFARPTMSYALYIQQFGRALRKMIGKEWAIIIDHVGNVSRHGLPDREQIWSLDRREKRGKGEKDPDIVPTRTCAECTALYEAFYVVCPYCGCEHVPVARSGPQFVDGNLLELDAATLAQMRGEIAAIDETGFDYRQRMEQSGLPRAFVASNVKKHMERQDAQTDLRQYISLWAGHQKAKQMPMDEAYRRFYFKFGIDVYSAMALKTTDANNLTVKIVNELLTL